MNPEFFFWTGLVAVTISMLAASASQSLHQLGVHELEEYCRRRDRFNWFDRIVEWREWMTIGAESVRVLGTVVAISAAIFWMSQPLESPHLMNWVQMVITIALMILVFNSWIPFAISQIASTPYVYYTWRIWWFAAVLAWPMIAGTRVVAGLVQRALGDPEEKDAEEEWLEDEILSIVSEGARGGLLESDERDMIEGVMELDEKDVFSVMTTRGRVDALDCGTNWIDAVEFVVKSGRTRVPVYDGRLDNILGILFAKDLLREFLLPPDSRKSLNSLVRTAMTVPESIMLNEMLQRFLKEHTHMAVVLDEYGAFSGIVTIEDILEEIVGDIVDETDQEKPYQVLKADGGQVQVDGRVRIDEINEALGSDIPEDEDFDTVAGWIMCRSRQIPRTGSKFVWDGVEIRVLRASRRMIDLVHLKALTREEVGANLLEVHEVHSESEFNPIHEPLNTGPEVSG